MSEKTNFLSNIFSGTYICSTTNDEKNKAVCVEHGNPGNVPKMVQAHFIKGGSDDLQDGTAAAPISLFIFATVPLEANGEPSKTKISFLIPDITTLPLNVNVPTKIEWTAYF